MKESYKQATQQIRRMLEEVGGSANAYEEVPSNPDNQKVSWEEALQSIKQSTSSSGEREHIFPNKQTVQASEVEKVEDDVEIDILRDGDCDDIFDAAMGIWSDTFGEVTKTQVFNDGVEISNIKCGTLFSVDYEYTGWAHELGELDTVYRTMKEAVNDPPIFAILDSGNYPVNKGEEGTSWVIEDTIKGFRYNLVDPASANKLDFPGLEADDTLIVVSNMEDDEQYLQNGYNRKPMGYIHNGEVFVRK